MLKASEIKEKLIIPLNGFLWGDVVERTRIVREISSLSTQLMESNKSFSGLFKQIEQYCSNLPYSENIGDFFRLLAPFIELLLLKKPALPKEERQAELKEQVARLKTLMAGGTVEPLPPEPEPPKSSFKYSFTEQDEENLDYSGIVEDPQMVDAFTAEALEFLDTAQAALLDLEHDDQNEEAINQVFRCFHTLKSSSAFLGFKNMEVLAHHMENLLGKIRKKDIHTTSLLIDIIFHGMGLIRDLLRVVDTSQYKKSSMINGFKSYNIVHYINLLERISQEHKVRHVGDILKEMGSLNQSGLEKILQKQEVDNRVFGDIAIKENEVSPQELQTALNKQTQQRQRQNFVRVSSDRLNQLVDLVGELVVNQSMVRQALQQESKATGHGVDQLESITTSIKDIVLSMGMVPVDELFQKLRVVVRNTARDLNKLVNFEVNGGDTEMDRNLVESIYDPLVHMVRNSVSHGIESPDERERKGKPRVGTITVNAQYRGNGIEVSVSDDGTGIDEQRVVKKAIALGLIRSDEEQDCLADSQRVYRLLFSPGFSTKDKADSISGRGVGMDVVLQNLNRVNGKVEVKSQWGEGSQFNIKLPLTLAIIDGFVTDIMGERYVLPFEVVEEILVHNEVTLVPMENEAPMILSRERYIPMVDIYQLLTGQPGTFEEPFVYLLAQHEGIKMAIPVNRVLGKQEIVIKDLNELIRNQKLFTGGTIFGDGSIGFILDFEELTRKKRNEQLEDPGAFELNSTEGNHPVQEKETQEEMDI